MAFLHILAAGQMVAHRGLIVSAQVAGAVLAADAGCAVGAVAFASDNVGACDGGVRR